MSLLTNIISVLMLATDNCLGIGNRLKRTGKIASISNSGWFFLNRVVDGLGNAVDGKRNH
jgi:F0F1-type ATP synthase alpha subunit